MLSFFTFIPVFHFGNTFQLFPKITQNIPCNFQKQNVKHLSHSDVLLMEDVFQSNICAMEHPIAWMDMMKIHDLTLAELLILGNKRISKFIKSDIPYLI